MKAVKGKQLNQKEKLEKNPNNPPPTKQTSKQNPPKNPNQTKKQTAQNPKEIHLFKPFFLFVLVWFGCVCLVGFCLGFVWVGFFLVY